MLQSDSRGLRIHLGDSKILHDISKMIKDAEKHTRQIGNQIIIKRNLLPGLNDSEILANLKDEIKPKVQDFLTRKYGISKPKQYAEMIVNNVLDAFPRRANRFKDKKEKFAKNPRVKCNFNLIPPISAKQAYQLDPNKAQIVKPNNNNEIEYIQLTEELTLLKGVFIRFSGPFDVKENIPVIVPTRQLYLVYDSDFLNKTCTTNNQFENRCGGWVSLAENGHTFYLTKLVSYTWETSYEPEGVVAFDFNARRQVFMAFSEKIVTIDVENVDFSNDGETNFLALPEFVKTALDELDEINRGLRKQTGDGDKRNRDKHLERQKLHRIIGAYFKPISKKLVEYIIKNKLLLGIDELKLQKNTSLGHHEFLDYFLLKELKRKKACFVLVPTPYTSKYCAKCLIEHGDFINAEEINKNKETGKNTVRCNRGHISDRDINASTNIALDAEYLFYNSYITNTKEALRQKRLTNVQRVNGVPLLLANIERPFRSKYSCDYRLVEEDELLQDVIF
jgi:hypothetical protein